MFTKSHHHHIMKLDFMKDQLKDLYIHMVIQAFAISMISVYIPIYLLDVGFDLKNVFVFLALQWGVFAFLSPFAGTIINRVGVREIVILRTPLFAFALYLLHVLPNNIFVWNYYYLIPFILGFSGILYTLSIGSLFANIMHSGKKGKETGKFVSLPSLGTIVGPLAGAVISIYFGFTFLFFFVSVFMVVSAVPLFFISHNLDHPSFKYKDLKKIFSKNLMLIPFLGAYGIKSFTFYILVPLSVYLFSANKLSLGAIMSVISLVSVCFTIFLGKIVDKLGYKKFLSKYAVITSAFLLIFGVFMKQSFMIYFSVISGFVSVIISIPFETYLFSNAKKSKAETSYLVFKEISLYLGRAFFFFLLVFFSSRLDLGFYLGAISSFIIRFL